MSVKYAVILHVFNEEKYLSTVIDAIKAQSQSPESIVIVDDGSTDNTPAIIHDLGLGHIHRPVSQPFEPAYKRRAHAFNDAVDLAKLISPDAECLLKVDGDTLIEPNYAWSLIRHMDYNVVAAVSGISTKYFKVRDLNNGAVLYRLRTLPKARAIQGWDRRIQIELLLAGYTFHVDESVSYTDLRMPTTMKPSIEKVIYNRTSRVLAESIGAFRRFIR